MKSKTNDITDVFDTIELNETGEEKSSLKFVSSLNLYLKIFLFKTRQMFSRNCDKSILGNFLDKIYYAILGLSLKIVATFLMTFSVVSLILSYFIHLDFQQFLINPNTLNCICTAMISLVFFTTKKSIEEIISSSRIIAPLSIVYTQHSVFSTANNDKNRYGRVSTAFFVGVLAGICSLLFPSSTIVIFLLSLIYCIFIFGRPECGLLFTIFAIPFFNETTVIFLSILTFAALLYKYLRGKRHIDFGWVHGIMPVVLLYVIIRAVNTDKNFADYQMMLNFICFFLVCITVASLVRTTAVLIRSIKIILTVSRIYSLILVCYIILCSVFSVQTTNNYLSNFALSGLASSLYSSRFILPFISIAFPLNFAMFLGNKKSQNVVKNILFLVLLFLLCVYCASYQMILSILVFSILNIIFVKPKYFFLILPCPAVAYGIVRLRNLIPDKYLISFSESINVNSEKVFSAIGDNLLFGVGIGHDTLLTEQGTCCINSSVINLISHIGVFGFALLIIMALAIIIKAIKSIYMSSVKLDSARTIAIGLVCSSLSLIISVVFCDGLSDFRIVYMFAVVLSLAYSAGRCYDSDYIDMSAVREYHQF